MTVPDSMPQPVPLGPEGGDFIGRVSQGVFFFRMKNQKVSRRSFPSRDPLSSRGGGRAPKSRNVTLVASRLKSGTLICGVRLWRVLKMDVTDEKGAGRSQELQGRIHFGDPFSGIPRDMRWRQRSPCFPSPCRLCLLIPRWSTGAGYYLPDQHQAGVEVGASAAHHSPRQGEQTVS